MSFPFKIPFAASGDQSTVPDSDLTGSVNFTDGYTPDYQADPSLDPNAKLIERDKFNFLMNKVTGAIGEIQRQGAADWYSDLAPYDLNVEVFYNGKRWRSTIANNSATPEAGSEWLNVTPGTAATRDAIGAGDLYSRGGIIGTVSQSGGVPTGAIIERGSNANGEYVKFADGTQECLIMIAPTTVTANAYVVQNVGYPASFSAPPEMVVSASIDFSISVGEMISVSDRGDAHTNTSSRIAILNTTSASSDVGCNVHAIGRWY